MSCLFNSLSFFINKSSFEIRQIICDYLEQNKPIIDGLDTKFILDMENKNYISHMRKTSTWGGAIEIKAACNIWNTTIIVHNIRSNQLTDPNKKKIVFKSFNNKEELVDNKHRIIEITWNGGHYEPVR